MGERGEWYFVSAKGESGDVPFPELTGALLELDARRGTAHRALAFDNARWHQIDPPPDGFSLRTAHALSRRLHTDVLALSCESVTSAFNYARYRSGRVVRKLEWDPDRGDWTSDGDAEAWESQVDGVERALTELPSGPDLHKVAEPLELPFDDTPAETWEAKPLDAARELLLQALDASGLIPEFVQTSRSWWLRWWWRLAGITTFKAHLIIVLYHPFFGQRRISDIYDDLRAGTERETFEVLPLSKTRVVERHGAVLEVGRPDGTRLRISSARNADAWAALIADPEAPVSLWV